MAWRCMKFPTCCAYSSVCFNMCGLGPTTDISPLRTLMNWGNSSIEVFLRNRPIDVIRGSSLVACFRCAVSLTFIDLNFQQSNSRLSNPVRFCLKITGPLELSLMIKAKIGNNHERTNIRTKAENTMSNRRFTILLPGSSNGVTGIFTTGIELYCTTSNGFDSHLG